MSKMGVNSFNALKKTQRVSRNTRQVAYVKCISNHLLVGLSEKPRNWEVQVFVDKSPNAFALPGNKIGVHTGLIDLVKNQSQLAAVIGHEIGHVKANHGNERASQGLVAQVGMTAADLALGRDSVSDQIILGALGLGAQFGVLLPFSRKHEQEADRLGVRYMAKSGFDPMQAAELWKLMKRKSGSGPPEILSTHPSPESRIKDLKKIGQRHLKEFQAVRVKPECDRERLK